MQAGERPAETLADLGEAALIERLAAFARAGQFGDDAALLTLAHGAGPTARLVITTDALVEDVHFSDATTAADDVGWRAATANLSDLAAMGCRAALGLTVALVAPPKTPWPWVEGVYSGLSAALEEAGGELLGGDCSGGRQRLLAITALGLVEAERAIRRDHGRPGDLLVSTGDHGLSRLGLALLRGELDAGQRQALPAALQRRAIHCHRRPQARFDAVRTLQHGWGGEPWRVAGTDSSDGLLAAAGWIAAASRCTAVLDRATLPLAAAMAALPQAESWCLAGGEDFELVLALAPEPARGLCRALPGSRLVGRLESGEPQVVWADNGQPVRAAQPGFAHFR
ncbi:MAG: thiamine-phosphate kinase [Cyanobacteriota bacterium]|nr:thiamine-phosphate kinase [Cyanobacteriota bacterium]